MSDQLDNVAAPAPFAHLAQAVVDLAKQVPAAEEVKQPLLAKKSKAEEEEGKDAKASDETDGDDENEKKKKSKKVAKKDDDDDDKKCLHMNSLALPEDGSDASDGADDRDDVMRAARARERGRIMSIVNSDAAKKNPLMALNLAMNTSMPRKQASAFLSGMPEAPKEVKAVGIDARMAAVKKPEIGSSDISAPESASTAAAIIAAGKKRRGEI